MILCINSASIMQKIQMNNNYPIKKTTNVLSPLYAILVWLGCLLVHPIFVTGDDSIWKRVFLCLKSSKQPLKNNRSDLWSIDRRRDTHLTEPVRNFKSSVTIFWRFLYSLYESKGRLDVFRGNTRLWGRSWLRFSTSSHPSEKGYFLRTMRAIARTGFTPSLVKIQ